MPAHNKGQPHDRSALILYGSETGNSQDAAEQLGRITERLRFITHVVEMNAVEINDLIKHSFVIFTVSTTGQGEVPGNAREFWKSLLRKRLPADCLGHVQFTTFGLGDSSYAKFNWAARKLQKRLEQLGAQEFYPRGEADEQHAEGTDGAFLPWSMHLKSRIIERYPLPEGFLVIPETELLPPKWTLELAETSEEVTEPWKTTSHPASEASEAPETASMDGPRYNKDLCIKGPLPEGERDPSDQNLPPPDMLPIPGAWIATVTCNTGITPIAHWQDVRHVELSFNKKIEYRPGDIVTIYPKNFPDDVDKLLELMNWTSEADKALTWCPSETSYHEDSFSPILRNFYTAKVPTLRSLLIHNLDITAIPRRFFFEVLAKFTDNTMHRERLLEFSNPALSDEFFDYATRPRRSMLEVLADFPSVRLPWRWAPYIFPRLQGRQFSICSGGRLKHPTDNSTHMEICVAIVQYRTVLKKIRQGVCSRYLLSLCPGTKINVTLDRGSFYIHPDVATRPLLLIAPGTGLAPIRSLLFERAQWISNGAVRKPSSCVLIFGNRTRKYDFLYHFDWRRPEFSDLKVLTAFSRDQPQKIYVQDVIRREAEMVYHMLVVAGGTIMVCGSSGKMPIAVRQALVDVLAEQAHGGVGKGDGMGLATEQETRWAEEEIKKLEKEGRYLQETW